MTVSSVQAEVQKLLYDALKASSAVMALVDGVYDQVPSNPFGAKQAYIAIGPSDVVDDDADCIYSSEVTFQFDVWSRTDGKVGCRKIVDAVRTELKKQDFELVDNALIDLEVRVGRTTDDPDGLTKHGLVMVTALVEESQS